VNEALGLDDKDVDLNEAVLTIRRGKNGNCRFVPNCVRLLKNGERSTPPLAKVETLASRWSQLTDQSVNKWRFRAEIERRPSRRGAKADTAGREEQIVALRLPLKRREPACLTSL
jgi:hypothetical protein